MRKKIVIIPYVTLVAEIWVYLLDYVNWTTPTPVMTTMTKLIILDTQNSLAVGSKSVVYLTPFSQNERIATKFDKEQRRMSHYASVG